MKHLRKFNEDTKTFKNTNEDIEMFFTDYTDDNPDALEIKNVLVNIKDNRVVDETPYMKDISKFRRAKMITLSVGKATGVTTRNGSCLTSFDILKEAVADIERFYALSKEEINYTINMVYDRLVITFITLGDDIKPEESYVDSIDKYLSELKEILKRRGYKRVNARGNWLEITTPKNGRSQYGDQSYDLRDLIRKISNNEITLDNVSQSDQNKIDLINWKNKVWEDGFNIIISGGDHQAVFKLSRR